jgi:hypothetical protein
MRTSYILTSIFLLFLSFSVVGQEERVYWNYDISHGLPTNNLYHVLIDHSGNIWFGSDYGVTCYDGSQFKTYTTEDGLLDNTVIRCYEDSLHRIWFQHINQAPTYFFKGEVHQLNKKYGNLNVSTATNFVELNKGHLILSGGFEKEEGFIEIYPDLSVKTTIENKGRTGTIICLKEHQVYIHAYAFPTKIKLKQKFAIINNELIKKWAAVGMDDKSVFRSFSSISENDYNLILKHGIKKTYHINKKGNRKYFATTDGLYCFVKKNEEWILESHLLKGKILVSVDQDKTGNLWATSINSGLFFFPKIKYTSINLSNNQRAVYCHVHDHKLYCIGENLSFSQIDSKGIRSAGYSSPTKFFPENATPNYNFIGNDLLHSNHDGYFMQYNLSRKWTKLYAMPNTYASMSVKNINDELVYFYNATQLCVLDLKQPELGVRNIAENLGRIRCLAEYKKTLYIGTQTGIYIQKNGLTKSFQNEIFGRSRITGMVALQEFLFIATGDKGLWKFNSATKELSQLKEVLFSNVIKGIYKGNDNSIWTHTNIGLQQLELVGGKLKEKRQIDIKTTLKVNDLVNAFELKDTLALITDKNFIFIPLNQPFRSKPLQLKIVSFATNGIKNELVDNLVLEFNESEITFNLSCVHHSAHSIEFSYRINDGPWIKNNSKLFTFSALSAGAYKFDFKAEAPFFKTAILENIRLTIKKRWWETNLAIFIAFMLSLTIESRKGISPLRSHGTVRESLPSYGSSC